MVAEQRAIEQAKRNAVEQAGTYVESYTKVKNYQVTEDEIKVISSGVMQVEVLDKKRTVTSGGEGILFWVKIKALVKTDNIDEMIKKMKEKDTVSQYKQLEEKYNQQQEEMDKLKKELNTVQTKDEKDIILTKISEQEQQFSALEWFSKGLFSTDLTQMTEYYTKAIEFNPDFAQAYYHLGITYCLKKDFPQALFYFKTAIKLDGNLKGYIKKDKYLNNLIDNMGVKDLFQVLL